MLWTVFHDHLQGTQNKCIHIACDSKIWVLFHNKPSIIYLVLKFSIMSLFGTFLLHIILCCIWLFNSLWSSEPIWQHRSGSALAQIMACCLMAITWTNVYLLSNVFCGIHLIANSQEVLMDLICNMWSDITPFKSVITWWISPHYSQ